MPYWFTTKTNTRYGLIAFDKNGVENSQDPNGIDGAFSKRLLTDSGKTPVSDIFFFSHGWKGDVAAAKDQYDLWIQAMVDLEPDQAAMGASFNPFWIGLHWPSLPWGNEELGTSSFGEVNEGASFEDLVATYRDRSE